jgi:cysteine desulfuration protein SufE
MNLQEREEEIIDEFSIFSDWMDKYEYLIDLGKEASPLDPKYKTDKYLIRGCQSQVWLRAWKEDGNVRFETDSDAFITKGIAALLVRFFDKLSPGEILNADLDFINKIGLKDHLSPTRANGLVSMIKQMKLYAIGLQHKTEI